MLAAIVILCRGILALCLVACAVALVWTVLWKSTLSAIPFFQEIFMDGGEKQQENAGKVREARKQGAETSKGKPKDVLL